MFQNFYDKVIVLSQKERQDRRKIFQREADSIGLQFEWFDSLEKHTPKESFNYSHYNILKNSILQHYDKVLVLEDDCSFKKMDMFWPVHIQLESMNWNWVYYGANLRPYPDHIEPKACTANLRTIQAAFTTHAIGYTKTAMNAVVSLYKPELGMMFDAWLDEYLLRTMPAHISYPFLCVQKPTFSDLWNRNVDYQDTFIASEEYIKDIC